MLKEGTMHIVYASDGRFAEIMGVSIVSLFHNNPNVEGIQLYILDGGISQSDKKKIGSVCKNYGRPLPVWVPAVDIRDELGLDVVADRGSLCQYARLFLSGVLPKGISRVLYLDCDIIIHKCLEELWGMDLHGKIVGAMLDAFSRQYRANIDLKPSDIMFNSGVMLIDFEQWREKDIEGKLKAFISGKRGRVQQGDQGALNAVLAHDTYCFPPRFNSVTIFHDFTYRQMLVYRKPPEFYPEEEIRLAAEHPVIIHFTTSFLSRRPWVEGCRHRYVGEWMKYKGMSPWADMPLWGDKQSWWKRKGLLIYRKLPEGIALKMAGIAQAYGRPLVNHFTCM